MLPGKLLFWGDNGQHQFWESEDHELLIFRNHGESHWTAHRNYGYLFRCKSDTEAATRLNVELSRSHVWTKKSGKFVLEISSEGGQEPVGSESLTAKPGKD